MITPSTLLDLASTAYNRRDALHIQTKQVASSHGIPGKTHFLVELSRFAKIALLHVQVGWCLEQTRQISRNATTIAAFGERMFKDEPADILQLGSKHITQRKNFNTFDVVRDYLVIWLDTIL